MADPLEAVAVRLPDVVDAAFHAGALGRLLRLLRLLRPVRPVRLLRPAG